MSTLTGITDCSDAARYLFSKIDTSKKGYIDKEDLVTAFSALSTGNTDTESFFSRLDGNSDGKITESEFSSALETLATALNGQYDQSRMTGMSSLPLPIDDNGKCPARNSFGHEIGVNRCVRERSGKC